MLLSLHVLLAAGSIGGHTEQVVGYVRVSSVQLGGEELAEGTEHLALALEVRLPLPCLPVVAVVVVLQQRLQGVGSCSHLRMEILENNRLF